MGLIHAENCQEMQVESNTILCRRSNSAVTRHGATHCDMLEQGGTPFGPVLPLRPSIPCMLSAFE